MDSWTVPQMLCLMEGGNGQLRAFFERNAGSRWRAAPGGASGDLEVYKTKAARYYREQLDVHVRKILHGRSRYEGRGRWRGRKGDGGGSGSGSGSGSNGSRNVIGEGNGEMRDVDGGGEGNIPPGVNAADCHRSKNANEGDRPPNQAASDEHWYKKLGAGLLSPNMYFSHSDGAPTPSGLGGTIPLITSVSSLSGYSGRSGSSVANTSVSSSGRVHLRDLFTDNDLWKKTTLAIPTAPSTDAGGSDWGIPASPSGSSERSYSTLASSRENAEHENLPMFPSENRRTGDFTYIDVCFQPLAGAMGMSLTKMILIDEITGEGEEAVVVTRIVQDGQADLHGVETGDICININGTPVLSYEGAMTLVREGKNFPLKMSFSRPIERLVNTKNQDHVDENEQSKDVLETYRKSSSEETYRVPPSNRTPESTRLYNASQLSSMIPTSQYSQNYTQLEKSKFGRVLSVSSTPPSLERKSSSAAALFRPFRIRRTNNSGKEKAHIVMDDSSSSTEQSTVSEEKSRIRTSTPRSGWLPAAVPTKVRDTLPPPPPVTAPVTGTSRFSPKRVLWKKGTEKTKSNEILKDPASPNQKKSRVGWRRKAKAGKAGGSENVEDHLESPPRFLVSSKDLDWSIPEDLGAEITRVDGEDGGGTSLDGNHGEDLASNFGNDDDEEQENDNLALLRQQDEQRMSMDTMMQKAPQPVRNLPQHEDVDMSDIVTDRQKDDYWKDARNLDMNQVPRSLDWGEDSFGVGVGVDPGRDSTTSPLQNGSEISSDHVPISPLSNSSPGTVTLDNGNIFHSTSSAFIRHQFRQHHAMHTIYDEDGLSSASSEDESFYPFSVHSQEKSANNQNSFSSNFKASSSAPKHGQLNSLGKKTSNNFRNISSLPIRPLSSQIEFFSEMDRLRPSSNGKLVVNSTSNSSSATATSKEDYELSVQKQQLHMSYSSEGDCDLAADLPSAALSPTFTSRDEQLFDYLVEEFEPTSPMVSNTGGTGAPSVLSPLPPQTDGNLSASFKPSFKAGTIDGERNAQMWDGGSSVYMMNSSETDAPLKYAREYMEI